MSGELEPSNPKTVAQFAAILSRIARGLVPPRAGLGELVASYQAAPQEEAPRYVGDEYGIALLYGYFYAYDDLEERPLEVSFAGEYGSAAFQALDREVVRLAGDWVRARYSVSRTGA